MPLKIVKKFLQLESAGGIVLFLTAILAMVWANSPLAFLHQQFIDRFLFMINEGLMALFFLLVGLELKRGYREGQLSNWQQLFLPLTAAIGGMVVPALIYCAMNYSDPVTLKGWAAPVATDIAFAMGVLSLFGKRVPFSLKLFLLSLAIFDDVGAVIIIALFYSGGISWFYLLLAAAIFSILFLINRASFPLYFILGILLWVSLLFSGIHPALTGVLLALTIPDSLSEKLETNLHPWVVFCVMPLFALANAGFSLQEITWVSLQSSVVLGIAAGLWIGKQIGVFFVSWCLIKMKWAKLPSQCSWVHLYGAALLCGIGFTMSLFLGTLSFSNEVHYLAEVRLGVIIGSLLSGLTGAMVFSFLRISRAQ